MFQTWDGYWKKQIHLVEEIKILRLKIQEKGSEVVKGDQRKLLSEAKACFLDIRRGILFGVIPRFRSKWQ